MGTCWGSHFVGDYSWQLEPLLDSLAHFLISVADTDFLWQSGGSHWRRRRDGSHAFSHQPCSFEQQGRVDSINDYLNWEGKMKEGLVLLPSVTGVHLLITHSHNRLNRNWFMFACSFVDSNLVQNEKVEGRGNNKRGESLRNSTANRSILNWSSVPRSLLLSKIFACLCKCLCSNRNSVWNKPISLTVCESGPNKCYNIEGHNSCKHSLGALGLSMNCNFSQ